MVGRKLPSTAPRKWRVLASSDGESCGARWMLRRRFWWLDMQCLVTRRGRHLILCNLEGGTATGDLDARGLAVRESELKERHPPLRGVVSELSEIDRTEILMSGSRTIRCVCVGSGHSTTIEACALEGRDWAQRIGPSVLGSRVLCTSASECSDV